MVKGFHKNNLPEYKMLCAFHQFVARGIRAYAYPILFWVFAIFLIVMGVVASNVSLYIGAGVLFAFGLALPFITLAMQNAKIERKVMQNPNYLKTEQFYAFGEDSFRLTIRAEGNAEEMDVPYAQVPRVHETRQYFYIYIGKSQVLILNKANITEGSADQLAEIFRRALGKRFRGKKKSAGGAERKSEQ